MNTKYKHIVAWGRYTGSYQYYIDSQVRLAEEENAPEDAIYKASLTGIWVRFSEVTNPHALSSIPFIIEHEEAKTNAG